jgi:hypothetical protein
MLGEVARANPRPATVSGPKSGECSPVSDERPAVDQAADQWRLVRRQVRPGERVALTMRSGSMAPLLPVGSRIEVVATDGQDCRVGDIVVYAEGERLVAHRLLLRWPWGAEQRFLQRGDGVSPAGVLPAAAILGRVVAVATDDGRHDLTAADARRQARQAVRRSLARLVRDVARSMLRREKR